MGTSFGHRPRSEPPSAMRAIIALLAFATVATCSPASSSSTYANAYSYQNLARKGKDSYDMEYVVKGQDYKGKPLDFNARESKYEYDTVGDYHAVLPEGYVCVCYAVGESAALKCDCGPGSNPPSRPPPVRPPPSSPKCTNQCPYGRLSGYPSCQCKSAPECTNQCPYGRLSGYPSCQCQSAPECPPCPEGAHKIEVPGTCGKCVEEVITRTLVEVGHVDNYKRKKSETYKELGRQYGLHSAEMIHRNEKTTLHQ